MFEITVIAVGKLKERFYLSAVEEYAKRLAAYCRLKLIELPEYRLPEQPSEAQIALALEKEAEQIRQKLPHGAWLCALTPEGKLYSSQALAEVLEGLKLSGKSSACFLLGSSYGMAASLKQQAELCLSMSPMTFPHHLARVMLLEQLYRAQSITAGSRYHK